MVEFKKKWKKLLYIYNFIYVLVAVSFYPIIPNILNYPPNSINNEFQIAINGLTYNQQYIVIVCLCTIIEDIALFFAHKSVKKLLIKIENNNNDKIDSIYLQSIKKLEQIPKIIYLLQIFVPVFLIASSFTMLNGKFNVILRVSLIFFAIFLSTATMSYTFAKKIFKDILIDLFYKIDKNKQLEKAVLNKIKRTSIKNSVIFIVMPLLIVTVIFITLLGYSTIINQNGDLLYKVYNVELNNIYNTNNINDIKVQLSKIKLNSLNDCYYIIDPNDKIYTSDNSELSEFYIKYSNDISQTQPEKNRTYGFYADDEQGVFRKITIDGKEYTIGIKYSTSSLELMRKVTIATIIIILFSITILIYTLYYIFDDVNMVTKRLNKMSKSNKIELEDRLPIASNDEVSDLIKSFTDIQDKTNNYIKQIEQDKYTIERQAQFTILGEFAGGLAHDLNSPLSAVKLDINTLKKYVNSDKISADEKTQNKLNEMLSNIDNSLNNMGNIIMGVRNQIRATGDTEKEEFLLIDIVEGIKILFRSILMKQNCQLNVEIDNDLKIYGERNKLDRVLGNLVKNSIDAYSENKLKGTIKISAKQDKEKTIISVSDNAGGIDEEIKEKIFTEIKTTKKENGTGFGLYYSNTIIESSFKGKMYFETEKDVGTTFYIEIPNNKEEKV